MYANGIFSSVHYVELVQQRIVSCKYSWIRSYMRLKSNPVHCNRALDAMAIIQNAFSFFPYQKVIIVIYNATSNAITRMGLWYLAISREALPPKKKSFKFRAFSHQNGSIST